MATRVPGQARRHPVVVGDGPGVGDVHVTQRPVHRMVAVVEPAVDLPAVLFGQRHHGFAASRHPGVQRLGETPFQVGRGRPDVLPDHHAAEVSHGPARL
jgi:hypothetical protein